MDTYFFDNPPKAIMKGAFLLLTYVGSILLKQFSVLILPTVFVYILSNISDYAELAFVRKDKVKKIRYWSLGIFVVMIVAAVIVYSLINSNDPNVSQVVSDIYHVFYLFCFFIWFIPMYDGIRGQCDQIRISSGTEEKHTHSDRAYRVMNAGTIDMKEDNHRNLY